MTKDVSTEPEHITLMGRTFGGYCILEVPARSAADAVHQLQKNPTMTGSNPSPSGDPLAFPFSLLAVTEPPVRL